MASVSRKTRTQHKGTVTSSQNGHIVLQVPSEYVPAPLHTSPLVTFSEVVSANVLWLDALDPVLNVATISTARLNWRSATTHKQQHKLNTVAGIQLNSGHQRAEITLQGPETVQKMTKVVHRKTHTLCKTCFLWVRVQMSESRQVTRMWANAQCDGRPAENRWRPLFNAAKFGWHPLLDYHAVTLPTLKSRWN